MKFNNILWILILLCQQSLSATNHSKFFHMPRIVYVEEVGCNLPPPSTLTVDGVGSDWIQVSWPAVIGADQYRLQAYDGASGLSLDNPLFVPGTATSAVVSTVGNHGTVFVRIWSVCANGDYDVNNYAESNLVDTVIIDLVTVGYDTPPNLNTTQVVGVGPANGVDISWLGEDLFFQVKYTFTGISYQRKFKLTVKSNSSPDWVIITDSSGNDLQHIVFRLEKGPTNTNIGILVGFREFVTTSETLATTIATLRPAYMGYSPGKWYRTSSNSPDCVVQKWFYTPSGAPPEGSGQVSAVDDQESSSSSPTLVTPNPFSNTITVNIPKAEAPVETTLQLYDLLGLKCMQHQMPAGETECTLQTAQLKSGVYFLRIASNGKLKTVKLVKTK